MKTNKAIIYSAMIENDELVSIKGKHYLITDSRITGLSWSKIIENDNTISFISNEEDKLTFEIRKYNDLFVKISIEVKISEKKCTKSYNMFNPKEPFCEDQYEYAKRLIDKRTNETYNFIESTVEQVYDLCKAYISLINIKKDGYEVEDIINQIRNQVCFNLDGISRAYQLEDLEDLVTFLCMFLSREELYEVIHILGDNINDFLLFRLCDDLVNLSYTKGDEVKNQIMDECLSETYSFL